MNNLQTLVNDFLKKYSDYQLNELMFYTNFKNEPKQLMHLIAWGITSEGKTHSHQCRIRKTVKANLEGYLLNNYDKIRQVKNFDQLMKLMRGIKGVGSLTRYDIASRLGMCFDVTPQKIYLHRGTYKGARNLIGDKVRGRSFLHVNDLPRELHCLTPLQIEDFLCIYRNSISNVKLPQKNCSGQPLTVGEVC